MNNAEQPNETEELGDGMRRRRVTMIDGRYLLYYTFDEPSGFDVSQGSAEDTDV